MFKMITTVINGKTIQVEVEEGALVIDVLREVLQRKGTKEGCGTGDCGACTILWNGKAVNACLVLAAQVEGKKIMTVEGLAANGQLHPLQQLFIDNWAFQCGYCTSGMLMSAYALLQNNPDPDPSEIQAAIAGNLCRCTGYHEIIEAVGEAAEKFQQV